jgi:hypothetical protein
LKEEVSAWTKVVGYGLAESDLVMGFGGWAVGVVGGAWSPLLLVLLVLLLEVWLFGEGRGFGFVVSLLGEVSIGDDGRSEFSERKLEEEEEEEEEERDF